ncbi:MAG: hypothetical protein ACOCUT_00990 [bacterium]
MNTYWTYHTGNFEETSVRNILNFRKEGEPIFSGRLSTGVFGNYDCPVGNVGPKSTSEVIVAIGDEGLEELIHLGFSPCQKCTPLENYPFDEKIAELVYEMYGSESMSEFSKLPLDARRVTYETIIPMIQGIPGRLYIPAGVNTKDVHEQRERFAALKYGTPIIGWMDENFEFREYE